MKATFLVGLRDNWADEDINEQTIEDDVSVCTGAERNIRDTRAD